MKILVICQYYYPEPFRIKDICEELVKRGHEVQVVTGYPNYPEGIIYDGYGRGKKIDEIINGVKVHRCFTIPRKSGVIYRFLNYYSYSMSSSGYIKKCMSSNGNPFDIVFVNQLSPVMMGRAAVIYKKKYKIPAIMYCLDLWPESLIAGGINRKSFIYKYYHHVSEKIYRRMDKIFITSKMFSDYLNKEFQIEKERIQYLPQYAENIFSMLPKKKKTEVVDFMFAGNIGVAQSIETILEAAEILKKEPVKIHIVGGGSELKYLMQRAKAIENVYFYGRKPVEQMPEFYAKADAMLVTMKADEALSLTLPGKVQSYMAVGKPIIGAADGEVDRIIKLAKCGYCGNAEDARGLAENMRCFVRNSSEERNQMSENAKSFYQKYFEKKKCIERLEKELLFMNNKWLK